MSDVWAKLEGHAINGVYPLLRHLGSTNHSVVFLTGSRSELALKLVPCVPALAELQLARWRASAALQHPRLIEIVDAGQCQIGGRHFLYVVTEYADQNLAQLLERRALTEEEAQEMLEPILEALTFLHEKRLVQGRLKPSNVLVVGDQLKLASDTIRPVSETGAASKVVSAYSPPEASEGTRNAASDVWALGVTLCEALTQHQPSGLHEGDLLVPPQLPPTYRGVVIRCLQRRARNRPTVKELQVWSHGAQLVASLSASGRHRVLSDIAGGDGMLEVIGPSDNPMLGRGADRRWMGLVLAVILGALALFVLGWAAVRSSGPTPARGAPDAIVQRATSTTS
jgi:serine/threonine protein kinase